jgi:hypothetical protein
LLFGGFVFLIAISDGIDQHLMEWMGR